MFLYFSPSCLFSISLPEHGTDIKNLYYSNGNKWNPCLVWVSVSARCDS